MLETHVWSEEQRKLFSRKQQFKQICSLSYLGWGYKKLGFRGGIACAIFPGESECCGSKVRISWFRFLFPHLLDLWPWSNHFTSLNVSFFILKMGIIIILCHEDIVRIKEENTNKGLHVTMHTINAETCPPSPCLPCHHSR